MIGHEHLSRRNFTSYSASRWVFRILLLAILVALSATGSIVGAASPNGAISGTVFEGNGTTPISGAAVFVNEFQTGEAAGRALTAADGTYTVSGLATGLYRVQVNARQLGYPVIYYDGATDAESATAVSVTDAGGTLPSTTGSINFTLSTGGSISGVVRKASDNSAVADADVWAEAYSGGEGSGTRTASDGTYTITGLPAGDYRVEASSRDLGFAAEYYQETSDFESATRVTVSVGATATGVDFTLSAGGTISGVVTRDSDDTPISGAEVSAHSDTGGWGHDTTAADGTYSVTGLPSGSYRVWVEASSQAFAGEFYDNTADWEQATKIAVSAGQTAANIDFSLAGGGSISGTVIRQSDGTPVADADVWADSYDGRGGNGTRTAADGTFTITGLAPGDYRVGSQHHEAGLAREYFNETGDWSLAARVAVTAGQTTTSTNFSLAAGGSISGKVITDSDGTAVADADVWADEYAGGGGNGTRTAADGTYTISGLTAGDYRVQVRAPEQGLAGEFYNDTTQWHEAAKVSVAAGTTTGDIDFSLAGGGSISGTVVRDSDGTPVANVDVWADTYQCCGGGNGTRTAADGTYTITGLQGGNYRVGVHISEGGMAGEFYNDTTAWDQASSVSVTVGQTTTGINFSLAAGGSISGTVVRDSDGTPIANVDVWAETYECCGGGSGTRTGADGTYTITGLTAGDYRVQVHIERGSLAGEFYDDTPDWDKASEVTVTAGATTPNINFSLGAGGSISGTVLRASDDTPVANADIWANVYDGGGGGGTRTAADGTYVISGLAAGDYRVQVHLDADNLAGEFYDGTSDWSQAARVTVAASQTTTGIDFSLDSSGSISGVVLKDSDDTPVANADVWAENYECCGGNGTRTAADGTYTITGLKPGDYRVQVHTDRQGLAGEFYNDTSDWDQADSVTVSAGQTTANIDFSLASGGSISGVVVKDSDGTPIANADVWANSYDCCGGNGTRTASDGTYTIIGLTAGDYRVQVHLRDEGLAGEFYDNTSSWDEADRVTVGAGQTSSGIDFSLGAGGSISGVVLKASDNSPLANADVWADGYDGGGGNGTRTAADGTYSISGLAPGDYRVQVHSSGQGLVHEFYDDTTDWEQAARVTVSAGLTTSDIDFSLSGGGSISGTVVKDSDGTPVADADVWAGTFECCGGNGTRTAADGTYTITGLAQGDYRVQVHADEQGLAGEFYNDTPEWNQATKVSVSAGSTTAGIDFSLAGGGSISGVVTRDSDSTPVADVDVWAESYECCSGGSGTRTAKDGTYTISGLASGDYRVQVHVENQGLAGEFYNNTTDWDTAAEVTVAAGQTTSAIDFSLGAGGSISGVVLKDSDGSPVPGADVWANSYDGGGGNGTRTAKDGTYTISGLASGDYRVEVHVGKEGLAGEFYNNTNAWDKAERVAVTAGQTTSAINFSLAAGGSISGVVLKESDGTPVANAGVWADDYDGGGGGGTRTAADGTYTITGLASGDYRVGAEGKDLAGEFYNDTTEWEEAARVTVSAGQTTSAINFSLATGGSISGVVLRASDNTPVADADVWAMSYDCCGGNGTRTAADGTYTITGLAAGDYRVEVQAEGLVEELYDNKTEWFQADRVTVTGGSDTGGIDFTLDAGGSISGRIYEADGVTPVAGADIWAENDGDGGNRAESSADGSYTITGLAPGDYEVQAQARGFVREFYPGTTDENAATVVTVTAGGNVTGIDFTLDVGGTISGTVYQADGSTPIGGAFVIAQPFSATWPEFGPSREATTNADGTYTIIGLAPGDHRVVAIADEAGFALEMYPGGIDPQAAGRVTVSSGADTGGIDFTLVPGGSISGTVYEVDGTTPVEGMAIVALHQPSGTLLGFGESEPDGSYSIEGLHAGEYLVVSIDFFGLGYAQEYYNDVADAGSATKVTVVALGETPEIDFTLALEE